MTNQPQETDANVRRLSIAQHLSAEPAIQSALEEKARATGIDAPSQPRRRMDIDEMLAVGSEIAAMPVLDPRPPHAIMDDLNAL